MALKTLLISIASIVLSAAVSNAATTGVWEATYDGNDPCPTLNGQKQDISSEVGTDFCLIKFEVKEDGSGFKTGENGSVVSGNGDDLDGNFTLTGAGGSSGTWIFDGLADYTVTHVVLKAGKVGFTVFELSDGTLSGDWMTGPYLVNKNGAAQGLSHISFYGKTSVIPLPAGAWLLLTGVVGLGFAKRRKA